ncbi:MAG: aspartate aminotransferase family protein [Bacteroidetes bacterium]|nr:aspartate aminotransferase family protein [Bacteroidota bacterium]
MMPTSVSLEQGDINQSALRSEYHQHLSPETKKIIEEDAEVFLHQALSTPVMNALSKTEGAFIYDMNGKPYLDLHGNGVHNAGFSNAYVIEKVINQLKRSLAFTPRRYTNIPAIDLAKKLVSIAPAGLNRVLFCPGGSEAIEMAVMLAKQITGKWKTISFWDSYHGTGFQAASVGGEEHFSTGNGPMVPGSFHVEFPNYYRNPWGLANTDDIDEEYIRQIKIILHRHPDMSALIAEPISATPVVPSQHYWKEVQSLCKRYGMFLIFDEIIEGFGRTGKMFASEHYVTPDVLVLGKTLGGGLMPFAGIITKDEYNVLQHRSVGHFTHEKNPLCCTAGLATIEYIEANDLVENSAKLGDYLMDQLKALGETYPIIGNVAGKGLHIGVDLVKNKKTKERAVKEAEAIMYHCMQQGVAFKIIEGNIITMRPSLVITKDHCDMIVTALKNSFEKINL